MSLTRTFLRRSILASRPAPTRLTFTTTRFASGDYGSGAGDPKGENPQDQGSNPSADLEHPGPPPPKAGQGSGGGPTKGSSTGNNTEASSQGDGNADSSDGASNSNSKSNSSGGDGGKSKGAQPKILNESPPENPSEEVQKHNKDVDKRAEQAHEKVADEDIEKDKVGKGFWYVFDNLLLFRSLRQLAVRFSVFIGLECGFIDDCDTDVWCLVRSGHGGADRQP